MGNDYALKLFRMLLQDEGHQGVVIGEDHGDIAPVEFLIECAEDLEEMGVKYIFTEKFLAPPFKFDEQYEKFFKDKKSDEPENVPYYEAEEVISAKGQTGNCTLKKFLSICKKHRIMVIGVNIDETGPNPRSRLESDKSTDCYSKDEKKSNEAKTERAKKLNEKATEIVKDKKKTMKEGEKYLILVGMAHAGTYYNASDEKIFGLDKRLKIPSVLINESGLRQVIINDENLSGQTICVVAALIYNIWESDEEIRDTREKMEANWLINWDSQRANSASVASRLKVLSCKSYSLDCTSFIEPQTKKETRSSTASRASASMSSSNMATMTSSASLSSSNFSSSTSGTQASRLLSSSRVSTLTNQDKKEEKKESQEEKKKQDSACPS